MKWIKAALGFAMFPTLKCSRAFANVSLCWGISSIVWFLDHDVEVCGWRNHLFLKRKSAVESNERGLYSNEPKWYCSLYLFQSSTEVVYNYYVSLFFSSMFNLTGQLCQLLFADNINGLNAHFCSFYQRPLLFFVLSSIL